MLIDGFVARFPRALKPGERERAELLLQDARDMIAAEFGRAGMNLDEEIARSDWLEAVVCRVVFEMVSAVLLVGDRAGVRQYSVTAGDITESGTYSDVNGSAWGGLVLTDKHRFDLGLVQHATARGRFPGAPAWPERRIRRVRYHS